ncbi:MAG: DNA adenine methylase [Bacteroidetes bacterium]|nr:DNA adenine methylase [Bacteroidota bacterium]
MKTPTVFYGGKMSLVSTILPLLNIPHTTFCEPYVGGGAVYWAKNPVPVEVINDHNGFVINFYKTLKSNFKNLEKKIQQTLYSRESHTVAKMVYKAPYLFSDVQKAWSFWVLVSQGFSGLLGGSWSFDRKSQKVRSFNNKKLHFTKELAKRLEHTQIECKDALELIISRDSKDTLFFIDPPYIGADQGHYAGFTEQDFENLLNILGTLQGKFLMTTYDSELLDGYVKKCGWFQRRFDKPITASNAKGKRKWKTEVFTTNYIV